MGHPSTRKAWIGMDSCHHLHHTSNIFGTWGTPQHRSVNTKYTFTPSHIAFTDACIECQFIQGEPNIWFFWCLQELGFLVFTPSSINRKYWRALQPGDLTHKDSACPHVSVWKEGSWRNVYWRVTTTHFIQFLQHLEVLHLCSGLMQWVCSWG
jgi:hypothetical protein